MKNLLLLVSFGCILSSCAQNADYNTAKGYIAEGYDVVAYFDNHAIKGNKQLKTSYHGVNYKFSSQENLDTFKTSPEKYTPQYGGYCAYAIAVNGKKVGINPKTYEIRDGKLYLFYNSLGINTKKKWEEENPHALKEKADKNWKKLLVTQ